MPELAGGVLPVEVLAGGVLAGGVVAGVLLSGVLLAGALLAGALLVELLLAAGVLAGADDSVPLADEQDELLPDALVLLVVLVADSPPLAGVLLAVPLLLVEAGPVALFASSRVVLTPATGAAEPDLPLLTGG